MRNAASARPAEEGRILAYQIHAFSNTVRGGNPAGVCLLDAWLDDARLQDIARDLGPSVTAFALREAEEGAQRVRCFTRSGREVDSLCGHAVFSAAHVLLGRLGADLDGLVLLTPVGAVRVGKDGDFLTMDLPRWESRPEPCPQVVRDSLGVAPAECHRGSRDVLVLFDSPEEVERLVPDYATLQSLGDTGLIATARLSEDEVVFRFLCPGFSISENEDHATGSALSTLAPFWAARLGRNEFVARQVSRRGGFFRCQVKPATVTIASQCATFVAGVVLSAEAYGRVPGAARDETEGSR